jgi:Double zinc ribbon
MKPETCSLCAQALLPGAEFCAACGHGVARRGDRPPSSLLCGACGAELIDGAAFCGACGTPNTAPMTTQTLANVTADVEPAVETELEGYADPVERPRRNVPLLTIALGIVGVLVVILLGLTFAVGGKNIGTSAAPPTSPPTTVSPTTVPTITAPTTPPATEPASTDPPATQAPTTFPEETSTTDAPLSPTTAPPVTTDSGTTQVSVQAHVVVDNSGLFIRSAPSRSSGQEVLLLAAGAEVTISCTSQGDAVSGSYKSSSEWDWLWAPVTGYVPDALLDTPDGGPPVADCGGSPPNPPTPPPYAGVLRFVTATPGLYVRSSPDINSTPSSDLKTGAGTTVFCTLPGTAIDNSGGTELWDRLIAPSSGYVADRYLSSSNANIPSC